MRFKNYANISTGNFNESTAAVYADDSLLTSNSDITREVDEVFHLFEDRYGRPDFKFLIVSPYDMRDSFISLIDKEIINAKKGKEAWVILKLNSLVDTQLVEKLYQASSEGVKITLIIRGICVLIPGKKGLSENISCISIVDKFLEHSRIMVFCNNNHPKYYISSADWMQRNFDRRIEVAAPILSPSLQQELMDMLNLQLKDSKKARLISKENPNVYLMEESKREVSSQTEIYKYFKRKRDNY